jgi:predicted sugar kinase
MGTGVDCLLNTSKCFLGGCGTFAKTTLYKMLKQYIEDDNEAIKLDINSFNQVLGAWARGRHQDFECRMLSIYEELLVEPP